MKQLYLIINIASVIVPILFSFHPKIKFYEKYNSIFPAMLLALVLFIPWDILFTYLGVWGFNRNYVLGFNFINLPIEEVMFFLCIPYACIFTYHCINKFMRIERFLKFEKVISLSLVLFLSVLAALNFTRLYTSVTFTALACFILFLKYILKVSWLHKFYLSYLILLFPFIIVNGLLTGTGLNEPIVSYNNNQNLGFRILTIPFEDVFYGMFLLMLSVSVYEHLSGKSKI
ncbi:MAG: lycopene cyclase domain-containing protein [Bacteroidetes bacterium]|nr:lycopene cyclase domain-containing protein [Bacteroidota bacterium]